MFCARARKGICRKKGNIFCHNPSKELLKGIQKDAAADAALKQQLQQSEKDKSENVMVVDLVRNDLSRICEEGSVKVDELFGVYSFPQVHQMISTITGELKEGVTFPEIISATFPMGSMTGAPKRRVMELIEQYEKTKRGIYSGAVGYISPEKDFDFNVVIRSILYNATNQYLSYLVGGGITFYSDPEKEYEECLLKAEAIRKVFS
jgi:para-aminobenzoate synthetase component 1